MRLAAVAAAAAVAGSALAFVACSPASSINPTVAALAQVGYTQVQVIGGKTVRVQVSDLGPQAGQHGAVGGVVWTTLPFRFDRLDIVTLAVGARSTETYSYTELAEIFGPRDPGLDRHGYSRGGDLTATSWLLLAAVVGVLGLFVVGRLRERSERGPGGVGSSGGLGGSADEEGRWSLTGPAFEDRPQPPVVGPDLVADGEPEPRPDQL